MFPLWFFVVLIVLICYLLYLTRTTEEDLRTMSRNQLNQSKYLMKENFPDN
ncbi:hypothetical protein [Flavisolibacter ginsenosidimutans]|uniref:hypothetical protein n=1 Tax=Flavisolibacter ginsenosidimutans TaxID=661481 RepID=UPI00155B2E6F|nr:hypothetical protein [Flavisolibacter ginsenosidimutans]